eukprot:gene5964-2509_t
MSVTLSRQQCLVIWVHGSKQPSGESSYFSNVCEDVIFEIVDFLSFSPKTIWICYDTNTMMEIQEREPQEKMQQNSLIHAPDNSLFCKEVFRRPFSLHIDPMFAAIGFHSCDQYSEAPSRLISVLGDVYGTGICLFDPNNMKVSKRWNVTGGVPSVCKMLRKPDCKQEPNILYFGKRKTGLEYYVDLNEKKPYIVNPESQPAQARTAKHELVPHRLNEPLFAIMYWKVNKKFIALQRSGIAQSDDGITWTNPIQVCRRVANGMIVPMNKHMWNDIAIAGTTAVIVGNRGSCAISTDAGASWRLVMQDGDVDLRRVEFLSFNDLVAVGGKGRIATSRDGGFTWQMKWVTDKLRNLSHSYGSQHGLITSSEAQIPLTELATFGRSGVIASGSSV